VPKKDIYTCAENIVFYFPNLRKALDAFHRDIKDLIDFEILIQMGSGAYICGEESALFESMEGKRGEPRNKPPYPTIAGFKGKPTVINNVETLVYAFMICKHGPQCASRNLEHPIQEVQRYFLFGRYANTRYL
jgi:[NiFe] hydrogenase diaphorase moiety large subunit